MHIQINVYYTFHQLTLSIRNSSSRSEKSSTRSSRSPSLECVKQGDGITRRLCLSLPSWWCHRLPVFPVPGKNISALTGSDRRVAENRRRGTMNSFLSSTSEQTNKDTVEETNKHGWSDVHRGRVFWKGDQDCLLCSFSLLSSVCLRAEQTDNGPAPVWDPACQHKIIVRNGSEDKNNEALKSFCLFVAGAQTNGGIVRCFSQNCTKKASSLGRPCSDFL